MFQKYKAIIEYNGTQYHGMQKQKDGIITIQSCIENAISTLIKRQISIRFASRTDADVHAMGQVIDFDLNTAEVDKFSDYELLRSINHFLGNEFISVVDVTKIDNEFHSRFNAVKKIYIYKIINRRAKLTLHKDTHLHVPEKLNVQSMINASKFFIGEHDFSSFRYVKCVSRNPVKKIDNIEIFQNNNEILIKFTAKSFMYNMIRIIVGTLLNVGKGKITPEYVKHIIASKDRNLAGKTVAGNGLHLMQVLY